MMLSSSSHVPSPDVLPSAAVPLGTGTGQRPSLLAAPENLRYRPVSPNSIPLSELSPFGEVSPIGVLAVPSGALHSTLGTKFGSRTRKNKQQCYLTRWVRLRPWAHPPALPCCSDFRTKLGVRADLGSEFPSPNTPPRL